MATTKRKYSISEIVIMYERLNQEIGEDVLTEIMALMDKGATEIALLAAKKELVKKRFLPLQVKTTIDRIVTTFHADASSVIMNGVNRSRRLADQKTKLVTESYFGGGNKPPTKKIQAAAAGGGGGRRPPKTPINPAGDNFGKHFNARQLSPRVWKLSNSYKSTINKTLVTEMKQGTPARAIAKKLKTNLRHSEGTERPGQGVYKSPMKNAQRLARTETNLAYQHQDYERWQQLWFVIGIEIKLSNRHPVYDICDSMVGIYPKDFKFAGWHASCLCIAIPVMASEEARDQMLDFQMGLRDTKPDVAYVSKMPKAASEWVDKNTARIKGWKKEPYFVQFNKKYISL